MRFSEGICSEGGIVVKRSYWLVLVLLAATGCANHASSDLPSSLAKYSPSEQNVSEPDVNVDDALLSVRRYSQHTSTSYEEQYRLLTSYWQELGACLNEAGWIGHEVRKANSPHVVFISPDVTGQEKEYVDAFVRCQEQTDGFPQEPIASRDIAENVYISQVDFRECALREGYSLTEPPSRESYVDAFLSGRINWDPQGELLETQQVTPSMFENFHEICPYWY